MVIGGSCSENLSYVSDFASILGRIKVKTGLDLLPM